MRALIQILLAIAFVAVSLTPAVFAADLHASNTVGGPYYNIHNRDNSAQRAIGQKFMTAPASDFVGQKAHHIAIYASSSTTTGNVCLAFGPSGNVLQTVCKSASTFPSQASPNWVDFNFAPTVTLSPSTTPYYEFYVYYDGTCTTCLRVYYTSSDVYRPGDSSAVKLTKEGSSAWAWPGHDTLFLYYLDHTAKVEVNGVTYSPDANGVRITMSGRVNNNDDSGSVPQLTFQTGTTTGYGADWTYGTANCYPSNGVYCQYSVWPFPQHTTYYYRLKAVNAGGTQYSSDLYGHQTFTTPNYQPGTATIPSGPSAARPGVQQWFAMSASDPYDNVWYELDVNGDGTADASSSSTYPGGSTGQVAYTFSSATTYSVRARARDTSGQGNQYGPWSSSTSIIIDGTAPSAPNVQSSSHPVGTTWYNNNDPSFTWTQSDSGGSGLTGTTHRLDAGSESGYYSHASYSYTDVSDGQHTFYATVRDNAGNTAGGSYTFRVDTQAPSLAQPAISGGTLGQNGWRTSDVSLRVDSSDSGSGVNCEAHSTSPSPIETYSTCAPSDTWTVTAEGSHTFYGMASDNSNPTRTRMGQDSLSFKLDKGVPIVTDNQPDVSWTSVNPTLDVDFGDSVSGLWTLEYSVWSQPGQSGTQLKPWTQFWSTTADSTGSYTQGWQADATAFQQGNNYVSVRATDRAGLQTAADIALIQWDTIAPVQATPVYASGTSGDNGWYRSDLGLAIDSADAASGIATEWHSNISPAGPWSGGTVADTWTDSSEGTESWFGRAVDAAGNDYVSSGVPFKVDKTAPVSDATITGTLGNNGWYTTNAVATLTASDQVSGVANVRHRLDGGSWTTTPGTSATVPVNGDGIHAVDYYPRDNAGNTGGSDAAPLTRQVKVDTTAPLSGSSLAGTMGDAGWYVSSVDVVLTATDAASGPAQVWYQVDGSGWASVQGATVTVPVGSDGLHTVQFFSVDAAGNADGSQTTPQSVTFKVDRTAPITSDSLSGTAGQGGWYRTPVTVTLLPTDALSGAQETRYGIGIPTTPTVYTGPFQVSGEGTTQLYYRSKDAAGNAEAAVARAIRIDTLAPTFSAWSQSPANLDSSQAGSVAVSLSVEPGPSGLASAEYRYSYDDGFTWSAWAPTAAGLGTQRSFAVPTPAGGWWQYKEGTLRYEVRAADLAGNEASDARSDTLERVAPTVAVTNPIAGSAWGGSVQTIGWTGRDADHDDVTYTVRLSSDGGATYYTTLYTATVAEDGIANEYEYTIDAALLTEGSNYAVKVEASDGLSTVSHVAGPFTVDRTKPTVALVSPGPGTLTVAGVEAPDPEGKTRITYYHRLEASAADAGVGASGVAVVRFYVDGAFFAEDSVAENGVYDALWSTLEVGTHTISVESEDRGGNLSGRVSRQVVVVTDLVSL